MISSSFPHRGEIYLVKAVKAAGDTKKRPAVVLSIDSLNQVARTILAVLVTSDLSGADLPTRVLIRAPEGGLKLDSLVICEYIMTLQKSYLERGPYGSLSQETMARIVEGVQIAIGVARE